MEVFDIAIIGAGPAGIMAAVTAAQNGKKVLLLEKNDQVGRKILATGNGRCNLTNKNISSDRYYGAEKHFIETVINQFDQHKVMIFFESRGVVIKEEDKGRIFPRTNQASTIVDTLKDVLKDLKVQVLTGIEVKSIEKENDFVIKTENKAFKASKLILATGGKAAHQLGSSGDGIFWAQKLGHHIVPIFAALCPVETKEEWVKELQGIRVEAKITSKIDGAIIKETLGDALFTHFGLSGPAVMAHAGAISPFVETKNVSLVLDLYPDLDEKELDDKIEKIFKNSGKKTVKNSLSGLLPAGLVPVIIDFAAVDQNKKTSEISKADRISIVRNIKSLILNIKKIRPLKEAQVSRGGVDTSEVNAETLESKIVKGLYFAGEIMDVDADSGGFNLQWAWSSGFVSGSSAVES